MSISIKFVTAAIKKSAVRRHYPDGFAGFRRDYPHATEDFYLFGLSSMSSGELLETLDRIGAAGLNLIDCCAVGDQFIGPIERHPHFEFVSASAASIPTWDVRIVDDDHKVLAEDGARLLLHHMRMGWTMSLEQEGDGQ